MCDAYAGVARRQERLGPLPVKCGAQERGACAHLMTGGNRVVADAFDLLRELRKSRVPRLDVAGRFDRRRSVDIADSPCDFAEDGARRHHPHDAQRPHIIAGKHLKHRRSLGC
jgi:hypothetical protein